LPQHSKRSGNLDSNAAEEVTTFGSRGREGNFEIERILHLK
jgi:hypothetical protein